MLTVEVLKCILYALEMYLVVLYAIQHLNAFSYSKLMQMSISMMQSFGVHNNIVYVL